MAELDNPRNNPLLPRLDAVGSVAAFLCAIHCAAMPLLLSTLPFAGIELLADHRIERVFVVLAALFGLIVIGAGYCRHRVGLVSASYVVGVVALFAGAFGDVHGASHPTLLAFGGLMLGMAHVLNRRAVRKHGCSENLWLRIWSAFVKA